MRQLAASALLIGNAVFLFVGLSDLLFVVDGWASEFGGRSAATFDAFAGPLAIALPLLAVLIATHVAPTVPQARGIVMAALASYGFGGLFGLITYMGAFAGDLFSVRATFDGLLLRAVWLAFLTVAAMAVYKIYRALDPPTSKAGYAYGPTVYGRPYPGHTREPQPTYKPGTAEPKSEQNNDPSTLDGPTAESGWPVIPPQASGAPTAIPDPTVRMAAPAEAQGDATR